MKNSYVLKNDRLYGMEGQYLVVRKLDGQLTAQYHVSEFYGAGEPDGNDYILYTFCTIREIPIVIFSEPVPGLNELVNSHTNELDKFLKAV